MVMEAVPTADVVGREFVRQYYTLLNQAPAHAHRFYNSNSYFVHGAMTKPAIGQRQIHQKIQQLNFRDCHAKISQVDSQATLGNGLVVQVSGELSNDGEPMRRFTQTFVLGAQSPKKYYVHNDIFRYQDMLLSDEEGDSPSEEDIEPQQDTQSETQPTTNLEYIKTGTPGPVDNTQLTSGITGGFSVNGNLMHEEPTVAPTQDTAPQPPVVNGGVLGEDLNIMLTSPTNVQPGPELKSPQDKITRTAGVNKAVVMEDAPEPMEPETGTVVSEEEPYQPDSSIEEPITEVSNEPKTYANLLKSVSSGMATSVSTSVPRNTGTSSYSPPTSVQRPADDVQGTPQPQRSVSRGPMRVAPGRGGMRMDRTSAPARTSFTDDPGSVNISSESQDRRRNAPHMNDHHQLFLGNLPHHATEDELKQLFSKFGTITDLRIHKHGQGAKGPPGGRDVPNYGFIAFETSQSVQDVLNNKPIFFPAEGGTKLNVEEKKKFRPQTSVPPQGNKTGGGGGGGGGGGSNNSENPSGGIRPQPRGPGGGSMIRGSSRARGTFNRGGPLNQRSNFARR